LPTVIVTSLTDVALKVGANRVLRGASFSSPCGKPSLDPADERRFRLALVRRAVMTLATPVDRPTLFDDGA
jgi:glycine/betaine/sarcosine/D-proline reductase family selenoprotein B